MEFIQCRSHKKIYTILSKCQFCLSMDSLKGVLTELLPDEKKSYFILQFLLWSFPMRQMFSLFQLQHDKVVRRELLELQSNPGTTSSCSLSRRSNHSLQYVCWTECDSGSQRQLCFLTHISSKIIKAENCLVMLHI